MAVLPHERCEYVDPITGKRCRRRATYRGDHQFCEGIGHDPAYPEDEVEEVEIEEVEEVEESEFVRCHCGCGAITNKGRIYLQGHDQRHRGILIREVKTGKQAAADLLVKKGWKTSAEVAALLPPPAREGE